MSPPPTEVYVAVAVPPHLNSLGGTRVYSPLAVEPGAIAPLIIEFHVANGTFYRFVSDDGGESFIPLRIDTAVPTEPLFTNGIPGSINLTAYRDPYRFTVFCEETGDYVSVYNRYIHAAAA